MRTFLAALAAFCISLPAVAQVPLDPVTMGGKTGTLTNNGDTVVLPIIGTQWATVRLTQTNTGTLGVSSQISIDGGINWIAPAYAKRLNLVNANPSLSALQNVTLTNADVWEIPLPANITHFRVVYASAGTAASFLLSGGATYTPGMTVYAVLADLSAAFTVGIVTPTLDVSGWATVDAHVSNADTGGVTRSFSISQIGDDGAVLNTIPVTAAGTNPVPTGASADLFLGPGTAPVPRRLTAAAGAGTGTGGSARLVVSTRR